MPAPAFPASTTAPDALPREAYVLRAPADTGGTDPATEPADLDRGGAVQHRRHVDQVTAVTWST